MAFEWYKSFLQDLGRVSANGEGGSFSPPAPENVVDPSHKLASSTILPKKQYFCHFHAVFGDVGQNAPTNGPLAGNPAGYR